ncbi:YVTN beta-propeller repeat-containing protein [Granulicella mallensis MP5ACTX8]|uniref:YVTN beta-propeller repeat-containing protein n=2 Tax=Granulicella mallensis TaxID=940614 RepID=G8NVI0_GRAMM|nr:YVTN beta-propeller repeat-containing protein [Granulicella mallensis MP5ACTX8]
MLASIRKSHAVQQKNIYSGRKDLSMIRLMRSLSIFAILAFTATTLFGQTKPLHVLAFYATHGEQDHVDFALQAISFFQEMSKRDHFDFETTSNWDDMSSSHLKQYQVVLWLNDAPSTAMQRTAFQDYMEHGGAWLGFHVAGYMDSRATWPWFADFLGTVFSGNSWPPLPARLDIDDPSHPAVKGLPASYTSPANEWYSWQPDLRKNHDIKVLMTLAPSNYPLGFKDTLTGGDVPVTWTNTKYKMIYTNMGHGNKILTSQEQNLFFENALLWLGGRNQ